jgi:hypothetical protein
VTFGKIVCQCGLEIHQGERYVEFAIKGTACEQTKQPGSRKLRLLAKFLICPNDIQPKCSSSAITLPEKAQNLSFFKIAQQAT